MSDTLTRHQIDIIRAVFDRQRPKRQTVAGISRFNIVALCDEVLDLRARLDAAEQERDKLWTLVNTASGMLKLLDRKEPHESVTGLLTAIADARAARKQPR